MRKAKGRTTSQMKKKVNTPSLLKSEARAKPSASKMGSSNRSSTKEVFTTNKGKRSDLYPFKSIRELISFNHCKVYVQLKHCRRILYKLHNQECQLAKVLRGYLKTLIGSTLLLLFFTLVG